MTAMFRCFAVLFFVASPALAEETYLLPPDAPVADVSQEDWSRTWWQWAASFERAASPVADLTGELCASRQSGDVWFLAGTYGSARTVRTCAVPRGKYLFFPIVNYVVTPNPRSTQPLSCAQAIDHAARMTDDLLRILLEIDGQSYDGLLEHRQATRAVLRFGRPLGAAVAPVSGRGQRLLTSCCGRCRPADTSSISVARCRATSRW